MDHVALRITLQTGVCVTMREGQIVLYCIHSSPLSHLPPHLLAVLRFGALNFNWKVRILPVENFSSMLGFKFAVHCVPTYSIMQMIFFSDFP